jgi:hypothetical protein
MRWRYTMTEEAKDGSRQAKEQPATAGSGDTTARGGPAVQTEEPFNPSAPGNTGTTPGTNAKIG